MDLNLQRPVVFFDLESTGVSVQKDRIVEYSFVKIMPDTSQLSMSGKINPEMEMSEEVIGIHGITNEAVKNAPTFAQKADEIIAFISGCDFGGYNIINYDIPMLDKEFTRAKKVFSFDNCSFLDAQKIFFKREPRTLEGALRYYCDKPLEGAHGAEADTLATIEVFNAQLKRYDDLPTSVEGIHLYCRECNPNWVEPSGRIRWEAGEAVIGFRSNFEKMPLKKIVEDSKGKQFLKWIMKNNFSLEVKDICKKALEGNFPTQVNK